MSKVKIEGNASGTGTLTISAPNTNTDRSLTLPDGAGEVLVTDGTITIDDTNDRVGIGTSSPSYPLDVDVGAPSSTDKTIARFSSETGTRDIGFVWDDSASTMGIATLTNHAMTFHINGNSNEKMRITSEGIIQAGNLNEKLGGGTRFVSLSGNGYASLRVRRGADSGDAVGFYGYGSNSSTVGSIYVTNSSTSYNTSSDYRLKENVVDMDGAIDRVKALQPRRFNFIADVDTTVDGFIAHEVSDVVPEAISGEKDATKEEEYEVTPAVLDDDGNVVTEAVMGTRTVPDYQGIDQSKLVPLLTGALQEAIAKIEALETRIEALENA